MSEPLIALKPCRHCAFTKHHLGTKDEVREVLAHLEQEGKVLQCHEYSNAHLCASHCVRKGIKGERAKVRGDLKHKYANITKQQKDACGLGGVKFNTELTA